MKDKIIIIGAGLAGTLLAIRLGQRGYTVDVYEKRGDMRKAELDAGRSINLALSHRGLWALQTAGLNEEVKELCIPMKGRRIHTLDGKEFLSPYSGRSADFINSISREGLNIMLLNEADKMDHVRLFFNQKCKKVDIEKGIAYLQDIASGKEYSEEATVIIGADGAGSAVRRSLMGHTTALRFNYQQYFLSHGYKELSIPPTASATHRIDKHALHIWPRDEFMIIALPNLDGSFTVTMFHPYEGKGGFDTLNTPEKLNAFFEEYYPELMQLMPDFEKEYFQNPTGTLGTIKCSPWQAYGKVLVLGDAAHAIVPFYGQGMNASFEDVRVFDEVLEKYEGDWSRILKEFQDLRMPDTDAIADLALDNFYEMQDKVNDDTFIRKRNLERKLEQNFSDYYSKYSLVTFKPDLPYEEAMRKGRKQDELLMEICKEKEEPDLEKVMEKVRAI